MDQKSPIYLCDKLSESIENNNFDSAISLLSQILERQIRVEIISNEKKNRIIDQDQDQNSCKISDIFRKIESNLKKNMIKNNENKVIDKSKNRKIKKRQVSESESKSESESEQENKKNLKKYNFRKMEDAFDEGGNIDNQKKKKNENKIKIKIKKDFELKIKKKFYGEISDDELDEIIQKSKTYEEAVKFAKKLN